jgi:hypothetical protein
MKTFVIKKLQSRREKETQRLKFIIIGTDPFARKEGTPPGGKSTQRRA